jgi:UDP:flavonoid glycosyltransferase YjiC (YdhE family)
VRILIVTSGSMGDVAPYTGLGARLRAAGHDVTVASHAPSSPVEPTQPAAVTRPARAQMASASSR